ncbi:MAG: YraN family protein [Dehalococcoidia bacterium]|nr:YraN family protein [Dehalococcoidia bacterium]
MPTPRTRLGQWGEELAGRFLEERGYRILDTNYRTRYGEVDIVAREGKELVFVEVRTRHSGGFGAPEESLSAAKMRRLVTTCQDYIQRRAVEDTEWRIDLVCVHLDRGREEPRIHHLRHAVQL